MATQYVNKPGSVIVNLKDGTSKHLLYGAEVPVDQLVDGTDVSSFADGTRRLDAVLPDQLEAEAHRRAAFAEDGQVNSSSSAVPGNYRELDEDGAAILVGNLQPYPEAQAQVVLHEMLYEGGRQKVLDAASDYAKMSAKAQIEAVAPELKSPAVLPDEPVPSGYGDPATTDPSVVVARALSQATGQPVSAASVAASRATPAPSTEQAAVVKAPTDAPGSSARGADGSDGGAGVASISTGPGSEDLAVKTGPDDSGAGSAPGESKEDEPDPDAPLPKDPNFDADRSNKPALEAEAARRKLDVVGTGQDGNVTVPDLRKALSA